MIPDTLSYTSEHEWVKIDGEVATIGITDHAQEQLGEITYVELPDIKKDVKPGDVLGVVESSKSASDIYSSMTGQIIEVNSDLETQPELINKDCYGGGWICKLRIAEAGGTKELMDAVAYEKYLKEQE